MRLVAIGVCLLLAAILQSPPSRAANALAGNPSPYLAMHGSDPVDWRPWGPAVLAIAQRENKPLFISSGYFACHWCHVMQEESYKDPDIAAKVNRHFVPVKLDRELHPALDAYLIGFVERTAGRAGWPLNVFLTPDGYPLFGFTYVPTEQFESFLDKVSEGWSADRKSLADLARRAADELARAWSLPVPASDEQISPPELGERLKRQALVNADDLMGGFGHQARFPMAPTLTALLELQAVAPDAELSSFLRLTLDAIAGKGLRDHLGGGFFRYTVDPDWETPHFEKMLYTQALLASLFLRAAEVLEHPGYKSVARDTLEFLLRTMKGENGGFIASLSAVDAEGIEGGYYLWREQELRDLLTDREFALLSQVWGLRGSSVNSLEEPTTKYLPRAAGDLRQAVAELGLPAAEAEDLWRSVRAKLLDARSKRRLPRDDKQIAGWNGLVLSALAAGVGAFDEEAYRRAGTELSTYLRERLWDGEQLHRAVSDAGWMGEASLEDYAFVAKGLRDWSLVSEKREELALSHRLVALAWERFFTDEGWRPWAQPLLPGVPGEPLLADNPLPSPAAVLMELTLMTGDDKQLDKVRAVQERVLAPLSRSPFVFANQAMLYLSYPSPVTASPR